MFLTSATHCHAALRAGITDTAAEGNVVDHGVLAAITPPTSPTAAVASGSTALVTPGRVHRPGHQAG